MEKLYTPERRKQRIKMYKTSGWRRVRKRVLEKNHYLCQLCLQKPKKQLTIANTCDHQFGWNDKKTFFRGPFLSLCAQCHKEKSHRDLQIMRKKQKTTLEVIDV